MIKIKLNLFESIAGATLLPNIGFVFTTLLLSISLIINQDPIVFKGLIIAYIVCFALLFLTISICILANKNSKKEFVLYDGRFEFLNRKYLTNQIISCEYYACKWYAIPIAFVYKQQAAGLFSITLNTGEKIQFKIFYKDYKKIKNKIQNITER